MTATERSPGLEKQELRRRILAIRDALDPRFHYEASLAAAKKAEAASYFHIATLCAGYGPFGP